MTLTLVTDRLTLRPQTLADFDLFADFLASDASIYMGGPLTRDAAWGWFCSDEASWTLLGHGALTVTETATGAPIGQVSIIQPPRFPEREIGWMAFAGRTGKGYITEAARALLGWAFGTRGYRTLVSYVDPRNERSSAVARRLGATLDRNVIAPDPGDLVWRHSPEAAR